MKRRKIVASAAAAIAFVGMGLSFAPPSANAAPQPGGSPAGTPTQSATKSVQVIRPDGSTPATNSESKLTSPTAYQTEFLKYTVVYNLADSVNLGTLQLLDSNDVVSGGYGTYVTSGDNAPKLSAAADPNSVVTTAPSVSNSNVVISGSGTSQTLTVNIPTNETSGNYTGIADGVYTLTYYVQLNGSTPIPTGLKDTSATVPAGDNNPLSVAGGVVNQKNTISVVATDDSAGANAAGAAVSNKDLGNASAPDGNGGTANGGNGNPTATVDLLPIPVASYDVTSAPGTDTPGSANPNNKAEHVTAGLGQPVTTTVSNTGNVPLDGSYTGNPDLNIGAAGKPVVNVTVNNSNENGGNGSSAATYQPGSSADVAYGNTTDQGGSLTYSNVGLGASKDATYTANTNSSDAANTVIWNPGVPNQPAGDFTQGTDQGDSNLIIDPLTPTGAILLALKNNAGPLIGGGAGIVALGAFLLFLKRRRDAEDDQQVALS